MAIGSHFAGRAIDISRTTAAHALSYGITKRYGISHGHAVSMTLGAFIEEHATAGPERLQSSIDPNEHRAAMNTIVSVLSARTGQAARANFTQLLHAIGLDPDLANAGATTTESRRELATMVNVERLGNNPVNFRAPELTELVNKK
jgi:alcohol dehydrogenase class IV